MYDSFDNTYQVSVGCFGIIVASRSHALILLQLIYKLVNLMKYWGFID